jgi:Type III restriction enzyme, res subunit
MAGWTAAAPQVLNFTTPDALGNIEAWLKIKPLPVVKAKPDPNYQVQALANIKSTFAKNDRATVVMACGTGKTLVALWAAEQENPKTVLVLVPSLIPLQQTLREWSEHTRWAPAQRASRAVCSAPAIISTTPDAASCGSTIHIASAGAQREGAGSVLPLGDVEDRPSETLKNCNFICA